jgi:beta-glucosidase
LITFLPGNRGGEAIADIIFGNYNPDAKLPISFPRGPNGQLTYDRRSITEGEMSIKYNPLFEFGHGLSYTQFSYSNIQITPQIVTKEDDKIEISVNVRNVGGVDGKEVVILYLRDSYACISRPVKQVKRFTKVKLTKDEEVKVNFQLTLDDLKFFNKDSKRISENGEFIVYIGSEEVKFNLELEPTSTQQQQQTEPPQSQTTTTTNSALTLNKKLSIFSLIIVLFLTSIIVIE